MQLCCSSLIPPWSFRDLNCLCMGIEYSVFFETIYKFSFNFVKFILTINLILILIRATPSFC